MITGPFCIIVGNLQFQQFFMYALFIGNTLSSVPQSMMMSSESCRVLVYHIQNAPIVPVIIFLDVSPNLFSTS